MMKTTYFRRFFCGSFLFPLLLAAAAMPAQAGPIKKVPVRITKSGKYQLIANAMPSDTAASDNDAAIVIDANDVELDLQGYTLSANPANTTITCGIVILGKEGIRIRNGRIRGFKIGLLGRSEARDVLVDGVEIKSPATAASSAAKGTHLRNCSFILDAATGKGLELDSSGGGPAHIVERCTFYATAAGNAATQIAAEVAGAQPAVIRECQFLGFGLGLSGNNVTAAADNVFQNCATKYDAGVTNLAGYNK